MYAKGKGVLEISVKFLLNRNEVNNLFISMIDLYENQFRDLLSPGDDSIKMKSFGNSIQSSAEKKQIATLGDLEKLVNAALKKRTTKATDQNRTSSRSHAFTIIENPNGKSQLVLADFAGFESSSNKENVKESISINSALSCFNKVLLDMKKKRVPNYAEHPLTTFLQPILKQSKTLVFYHISEPSIVKYLNLIEDLMEVRVIKRSAPVIHSSIPKKTLRPMKL